MLDAGRDKWKAIGHVPVKAAVLSSCGFSGDVPRGYHEKWTEANVEVFKRLGRARDNDERKRAQRWQLMLHQIYLRKPIGPSGRGGSRAHDAYRGRFAAWRDIRVRQSRALVEARPRENAALSRHAPDAVGRGDLGRALALIEEGGVCS